MINSAGTFKSSKAPLFWACVYLAAAFAAAACGGGGNGHDTKTQTKPTSGETSGAPLSVHSDAFAPDQPIPSRFTCDGEDISPGLSWSNLPEGTYFSSLIMEDLDAPNGFAHWVVYNIPTAGLPEAVTEGLVLETGGVQGVNDFGRLAYNGPCPPAGSRHRYSFTAYALNGLIYPPETASKQDVVGAMKGHILGQAQLIGTYER
jgi:Raf kinase inhibitor-like YbhB/YbcL family protein